MAASSGIPAYGRVADVARHLQYAERIAPELRRRCSRVSKHEPARENARRAARQRRRVDVERHEPSRS
jgi:hypothetical protein